MQIHVKQSQGKDIFIPLPSALVFNRFTAGYLAKQMKENGFRMDKGQARALIKALNRYRRTHRDWVLVEVESADGDHVLIKL